MSLRFGSLLVAALALMALAAACGGGGQEPAAGQPTPSPAAATATPTGQPTAQLTVLPSPTQAPSPSPEVEITPVPSFQITVSAENSGLRIRERPQATEDTEILGAIYQGWKATVLGQARGQEVEPGLGDLWYYVEMSQNGETIRGFVYAAYVEEAE